MDVAVGDVVDASVADVLSSPCLEASTILLLLVWIVGNVGVCSAYLAVQQRHILDVRVLDDILDSCVLPNTAHTHPMSVVAPEVLDEDVGCVRLGREAVIANIDAGVCHTETVHIVRIEAVGVLRFSLLHVARIRQSRQPGEGERLTEAFVENAWM